MKILVLAVTNLTRLFILSKDGKKTGLSDPNPALTPAEVMKFYLTKHPELTNAQAEGPVILDGKAVYTFKTAAGKLG